MKRVQTAFTLVEVMFGLVLLTMTAFMFAAVFSVAARVQSSARHREQATRIARREIEALRRQPFAKLTNLASLKAASPAVVDAAATGAQPWSFANLADDAVTGDSVAQSLPGGTATFQVDDVLTSDPTVVSATTTNLRRITVTIRWIESGDKQKSVTLQSLIAYLEKKT